MAKTLDQFATDIRGYLTKGKAKNARKVLEKAAKAGLDGPGLQELELEVQLAEGDSAGAAKTFAQLAAAGEKAAAGAMRTVDVHLRRNKDDHSLRDVLWEQLLAGGDYEAALKHLSSLLRNNAIDAQERAQRLLGRRDATGAIGIFLLASLGAIRTDRMKLVDRLVANETGARMLGGLCAVLYAQGHEDGELHYALAQLARKSGDKEKFLEYAGRAFEENPEGLWTWTMEHVPAGEQLELAARSQSIHHLLQAAGRAKPEEIVAAGKEASGEGSAGRALRSFSLLLSGKPPNACRIAETLVGEDAEAAGPMLDFLAGRFDEWPGSRELYAAVAAAAGGPDAERAGQAADALLSVPDDERSDAWMRAAPRLLELAPKRDDLRGAVGLRLLADGDETAVAGLLTGPEHVAVARGWSERAHLPGPVLLAAARCAEQGDAVAEHAEWLLKAAAGDGDLLAELGTIVGGAAVSPETALETAEMLLAQGQKGEVASLLERLPLDRASGAASDALLKEKGLLDDRAFAKVSFRNALAVGDAHRARRLAGSAGDEDEKLGAQAAAHPEAATVLADLWISGGKGAAAVGLLDARRRAGDDAAHLMPLADTLLKAEPQLAAGRVLRARLLQAAGRDGDAVRDLRTVPATADEFADAYTLLGELADGSAGGDARLGRADLQVAREKWDEAVKELGACPAPPAERLQRYEAIAQKKPDYGAAHRGRAVCLLELGRRREAAEAHFQRFRAPDDRATKVADDLEEVARAALDADDLAVGRLVLEQLPDHVSDGAERALRVIGDDQRPALLILRSQLQLQLQQAGDAVGTLRDLVRTDPASRSQAAQALEAIIESGRARPDADLALAMAYDAMDQKSRALATLTRLYEDDLTSKENVAKAAGELVVKADDPEVRLFLGRVALDLRDARQATEHAVHARRLRPGVRRDCVDLLQRALTLDSFAPATHFALAEAHLAGDEVDDAVRHFRSAVEVDRARAKDAIEVMAEAAPRSKAPAMLWLAVGTTWAEFQKDHASAVGAFTNGLEANPPAELRVPLLLGRGDSYAALKEETRAFDDFDEASQHARLERRYYEFLRSRHRLKVLEVAEKARGKAGEDFASAVEACGRFVRLGQADEAVEVAQKALAAAPTGISERYLSGVALHAAGRYDAAAQVLETVRQAAGAETAVGRAARMLLAESYLDSGDRGHARACLIEIEAVDANYPGLKARRGALAPPADDPQAPPPLFVRPEFPRPAQ